jgi:hypothetical protein
VHYSIKKLGQSLHLRCLNERIKVSTTAPASNFSGNVLVTAPARNPRDSSFNELSILMSMLPSNG